MMMAHIIVTGYMIRHPVAGNMMAYFQYLLGFVRLGHKVSYLEESGWADSCYNPESGCYGNNPARGIAIVQALIARYNVDIPVYYIDRNTGFINGIDASGLEQALSSVDLLLNIGGVCSLPEFKLAPRRALVDMDPLFTQLGRFASEDLRDYDIHFSYGTNIGQADCTIPACGLEWLPTVPPIVPDIWHGHASGKYQGVTEAPFTTICNWNAYGGIDYEGEHYGQKDEEFLRLLELPRHVDARLELALAGISPKTKRELAAAGWLTLDAAEVSNDLVSYQTYIADSLAEFSAAKQAYVKTRSGWFSDRSACYLAAGRPVIVQDTGAGRWLNTGDGVLVFGSLEEAVDCIEQVKSNYLRHCSNAQEIAEQVFSYRVVLPGILERAFTDSGEIAIFPNIKQ